jgi:Spy/CpxP family protein refolding chaperone
MNANKTFIVSALFTLFAATATAQNQTPKNQTGVETKTPRPAAGRHAGGRIGRRTELHRFLRTLKMTDAQRSVALDQARAADPIARSARAEAAKIRAEALRAHPDDRAAARAEMKGKLKDLRERTLADLKPLAQRVLSTLTPEQRTKLADAAKKRGRTLDEARLEKMTSWLLTRPRLAHRLEKQVEPRTGR